MRGKDLKTGIVTTATRDENLSKFKEALDIVTNLNNWHAYLNLFAQAGYINGDFVAATNAVVYCYVMYLIGKYEYKVKTAELNKIITKWIYMTTVTFLYSGSTESTVEGIGRLADGTVAVYQALPWDMRCWLSGSGPNGNANHLGYVGFEICEDSTENEPYFLEAVREKAVLLTAHLCQMMGVRPDQVAQETKNGPAYAVMDHESLHRVGLASNHGDIGLWLRQYGYTFRDFRAWVQEALDEDVHVNYIDAQEKEGAAMEHPILRRGDSGSAVIYLQTLLGDTGPALRADGIFGAVTEAAVKDFQALGRLTMDGIVGPLTWAALEKATGHAADGLELTNDTVAIRKSDWNAVRAAYAAISGIIRKYENVG